MTVKERVLAVIAEHPDWKDMQVAEHVGCTKATVWKARHAERVAEWNRRDNAARREYKSEWQAARYRSPEGRARCANCGATCGIGTAHSGVQFCKACYLARQAAATQPKAREFERLWNEGKTLRQIGEAMGMSRSSACGFLWKYRDAGYDLPYRNRTYAGRDLQAV